jgi:hypothetical protein
MFLNTDNLLFGSVGGEALSARALSLSVKLLPTDDPAIEPVSKTARPTRNMPLSVVVGTQPAAEAHKQRWSRELAINIIAISALWISASGHFLSKP